ncbi:pyruvate kinase [Ammonifex degensii KC4]|uniref:Pyruvate kinase n=1 Tax=Ammonifex degensii (strain DSM 10501 / KC4) TaxID=429009 RepID=C9RBG5_AMMDK|nr:pyruvate kinase [Ammonifex degensii]ACX51592.1 pyruvate kinase [Ammonifex degensii KC4]
MLRHTKIVCTIGPSSSNPAVIESLLRAGMDVARINMSHGTQEEHRQRIRLLREIAQRLVKNLGILVDIRGPRIRIGELQGGKVELREGEEVELVPGDFLGTSSRLPVNYPGIVEDLKPGDPVLLADGLIGLRVKEVSPSGVRCRVEAGGELTPHKGVNLPGVKVNLPSLTEKDVEDIKFAVSERVDFLALSYVRRADDVLAARRLLEELGAGDLWLIAKIENREGVENLHAILKVADGVMVARGDLGLEIPLEEVPLVQKEIISRANAAGKPVITATQMLESMIQHPRPTRAEVADVANAILDGTDAVMLSAETAIGHYPAETVATMARIASRTEEAFSYEDSLERRRETQAKHTVTDAISFATCAAARDLGAAAIITATQTGYTARMVAKYRPRAPILAATPRVEVMRRLALVWGVYPILVERMENTDQMIDEAVRAAMASGYIKSGDLVVITAGVPVGVHGTTNLLKVHTVGDVLARGMGIGAKSVTGRVRIAKTAKEALEKVQPGDILVAPATDKEYIPAIRKCAGIVTEVGGVTSHAAIVGLEFGIPVIVGVEGATAILQDGQEVTLDGQRGIIYRGSARVL